MWSNHSQTSAVSLIAAVLLFSVTASHADEFVLDTETGLGQVGGLYGELDPPMPDDPPIIFAPDNKDGFQNYFMGRSTISGTTLSERRAFFMFDTAGLAASIPDGHTITDVSLKLDLIFGGVMANFSGAPPLEFVTFTSTDVSAADILAADISDPPEMLGIFDSFGFGTEYGGFDIFPGTSDTPTLPGEHIIPLPGAIADLTDAIAAGDVFVITARLATYDPGPVDSDPFEFVFGLTDVVKTVETSPGVFERVVDGGLLPELTFTTVPEPSSMLLLSGLFAGLAIRRRRAK